jgi:hypothetical protein
MHTSPSIAPTEEDVYLDEDELGRLGRVWIEADSNVTDLETVLKDMMTRQYSNPVRVVAFNVSEGWSRDVPEDVAIEPRRRCGQQVTRSRRGLRSSSNGTMRPSGPDGLPFSPSMPV